MSHGSLIPGNSFHPILALASFSLVLDELLLVLGLDKLAFVVNLIMLPRETYGDSPKAFMCGSWIAFHPYLILLDFAPAENPEVRHREALPMAECPQNNCKF